ncbi:hypothetical protein BB558_005330 [Smittium angustum]|uniref:Armadillo repeat-containing domain-containing protein n=1 Tax=Smittium angustum TaxID=133377 RepID=A0A2U1J0Q4_SMIAN|nr:hypothetical protein BB558_005330 [Smittium angustum]
MDPNKMNTLFLGCFGILGLYRIYRYVLNLNIERFLAKKPLEHEDSTSNTTDYRNVAIFNSFANRDSGFPVLENQQAYALLLLSLSNVVELSGPAEKALLTQVMDESCLNMMLELLKTSTDYSLQDKAMEIICLLSENGENCNRLAEKGVLRVMLQKMGSELTPQNSNSIYQAAFIVQNILQNVLQHKSSRFSNQYITDGLLSNILNIFKNHDQYSYPTIKILVDIVNQLSIRDYLCRKLFNAKIEVGILTLLNEHTSETSQVRKLLETMLNIMTQSGASADDQNIIIWAIGMIHELLIQDVGNKDFSRINGLAQLLSNHLNLSKATYANGLILRIYWCLYNHKDEMRVFSNEIIKTPVLLRILGLLGLKDYEICYWVVDILSRVSANAISHPWIVSSNFFSNIRIFLKSKNDYNRQIRQDLSIICMHLLNSEVGSSILESVDSFNEVYLDLLENKTPEIILNLSLAVIGHSIHTKKSTSIYYTKDLENGFIDLLLDQTHDRLHIQAAKNAASLVNIGI